MNKNREVAITKIRIVGCGCDLCDRLEKNVKSAAERIGIEFEFLKVCEYETMMTPILFVDDKMISAAKLLSVPELEDKLTPLTQSGDKETRR